MGTKPKPETREYPAACPTCETAHSFSTNQARMRALIRWHVNIRNLIDKALRWPDWITK